MADHVDHVARVAGHHHVGLGGDFDGTTLLPHGLEDVSCYPRLIAELIGRGWTDEQLRRAQLPQHAPCHAGRGVGCRLTPSGILRGMMRGGARAVLQA